MNSCHPKNHQTAPKKELTNKNFIERSDKGKIKLIAKATTAMTNDQPWMICEISFLFM